MYKRTSSKNSALKSSVVVNGDDGDKVVLKVKEAKVDKELKKKGTGALAGMWADQSRKIEAAIKIQAAMRGRKTRSDRAKAMLAKANGRR